MDLGEQIDQLQGLASLLLVEGEDVDHGDHVESERWLLIAHVEVVLIGGILDHFSEDGDLAVTTLKVEVLHVVVVVISGVELSSVQVLLLIAVVAGSLRALRNVGSLWVESQLSLVVLELVTLVPVSFGLELRSNMSIG